MRGMVTVCNISAQPITKKSKSQLCCLQEMNVIKTMDPSCNSVSVGATSKSLNVLSQCELNKTKAK